MILNNSEEQQPGIGSHQIKIVEERKLPKTTRNLPLTPDQSYLKKQHDDYDDQVTLPPLGHQQSGEYLHTLK